MTHISELKSKIDEVVRLLSLVDEEADQMASRKTVLDQFDFKLREREQEINKKMQKVDEKDAKLESERDYIVKRTNDLSDKEFKLEAKQREIDEGKKIFLELEKERDAVRREKEGLEEQIKALDNFAKEKQNIEHLRGMLERESIIDRERKKLLNEQESSLLKEKDRLQKIADQMEK